MSCKKIVSARSVLQSIREGLSTQQLMEKLGLSPASVAVVVKQIEEERNRRATQIVEDFVSGMKVQDIATRNGFPTGRFLDILRTALSLQPCSLSHLPTTANPTECQDSDRERRQHPRISYPVLTPHVREVDSHGGEGTILDISEKGVAVKGIWAEVADEKTLSIGEANLDLPDPIVLTCTCRWTDKTEDPTVGQSAGFEITEISKSDDRYLRSLIEAEERLTASQQFIGT